MRALRTHPRRAAHIAVSLRSLALGSAAARSRFIQRFY